MAEYHFPIPGSIDEKKIVLFARRHWASFIGQFCLSALMFILVAMPPAKENMVSAVKR